MSRNTRSQVVADENAAPAREREGIFRSFAKHIGVSKPPPPPAVNKSMAVSRKTTGRSALHDISNQSQKHPEQLPKKKRVEEITTVCAPPPPPPPEVKSASEDNDYPDQARPESDDVDMRHDEEEQRSLENSVAELKLELDPDATNPQCVSEYINDIMSHLFEVETKRMAAPGYMARQSDINTKMREILVDWLVEVHLKFKLRDETLYLTVNFIDRFLEKCTVARTKLQLVGCTAMLMAAKYEEIYPPEVRDFVYISDQAYTKDEILAMESLMLNTLGFYLTVPTTLRFGERLCRVGKVSVETETCTRYLMELTLQDARFLRYRPSEIAAGATFLGCKMTGHYWNGTMEHHAGYDRARLNEVLTDLHELASRDPPKYKAVRKKYAQKKFHEVSKIAVCTI